MARKNIFELVEENYNISTEINKIEELFFTEKYFHKTFNCAWRISKSAYFVKDILHSSWLILFYTLYLRSKYKV